MPEPFEPIAVEDITGEASIQIGLTLNLGNYESARVDIGGRVSIRREDLDATSDKLKEWAAERIGRESREIRGKL